MIRLVKGGINKLVPNEIKAKKWLDLGYERVEEVEEEKIDKRLTVAELKELCKEKGLTGYSKLREAELIELLNGVDNGENTK